ncbi:MAG: hemerythrin domain-containing protein [bacterium]|nr:hemerythrin domain-containing protein [bacterium]
MRVVDVLTGEHGVFHFLVEQLDDAVGHCTTLVELRAAAAPMAIALLGHARIEEATLFAPLERELGLGTTGPLHCLREEHQEMDRVVKAMFAQRELPALRAGVRELVELTRKHLGREETVLFAAANEALAVGRSEQLGAEWARARGITGIIRGGA